MKKKVTLLCAVAAMGIAAVAGVSLQNRTQLSDVALANICLLYTSPSPRDYAASRMPSSA